MGTHVLLLGEGNFSFSQDILKILIEHPPKDEIRSIVATSFDTRSEVLEKYSNSEKTLNGLNTNEIVTVLHGIDATKELKAQLMNTPSEMTSFDHVIFNFPHLGYEDLKAHSSLIAHILYRYPCAYLQLFTQLV